MFCLRKNVYLALLFCCWFLIRADKLFAQEFPLWVKEMHRPFPDVILLQKEFNNFWMDKMSEDSESNFEADEFNIREEYSWLRPYIHEYFEKLKLGNFPRNHEDHSLRRQMQTSSAGDWYCIGPFDHFNDDYNNVTNTRYGIGRSQQVAFSYQRPNVAYALGAASLFISTDTGSTWQPSGTDQMTYGSTFCMAVDPNNDSIIYIGMGDYYYDPHHWLAQSIYKSVDFGQTFLPLSGGLDSSSVYRIVIDPLNSNHIVAAGFRGLWYSSDAGQNWQNTFYMNDTLVTGHIMMDIKFRPGSSDTVFASCDTAFYYSINGGQNWTQGFSDFQFTNAGSKVILIGVTPSNPDYVYLFTAQDFGNIYKSVDGGITFTPTKKYTNPNLVGYHYSFLDFGQGWYDIAFYADPFDSLTLYTGSIYVYKSTDGGITWDSTFSTVASIHPDQRFLVKSPWIQDRIWVSNDGGVCSKGAGDSTFVYQDNGFTTTQMYHYGSDNFRDSSYVLSTQDNGLAYTLDGVRYNIMLGGDFYSVATAAYHSSLIYFSSGGAIDMDQPNIIHGYTFPEVAIYEPVYFSPYHASNGFCADYNVWETNNISDSIVNWRKIISNPVGVAEFSSLQQSLADSNLFFAVRNDGWLFRTSDVYSANPFLDSFQLPSGNYWLSSITTVPTDPDVVYLAADKILKSTDRGQTWSDVNPGINPLSGFQFVKADPYVNDGSVYLAAQNKVFYCNDSLSWVDYSNQLPVSTFISDLHIRNIDNQIHRVEVSLFGRGIWHSPAYQELYSTTSDLEIPESSLIAFPNPSTGIVNINLENGNPVSELKVYSSNGKLILIATPEVSKSKVNIDLQKFSPGVFYLQAKTKTGFSVGKIVLER